MQTQTVRSQILFLGVDVHKDTHTAIGLNPFGEKVFEMTIGNEVNDFISLVEKTKSEANNVGLVPFFGLEDVHSWGERLSSFLVEEGLPVKSVAPVLVDRHRSKTTHPEKSDSLDAQGVAEVMIQKIDTLPTYTLSKEARKAKQIRELSLDSGYRTKFKDPFALKALRYWKKSVPKNIDGILLGRMKRAVRRLLDLREEIQEIEKELEVMMKENTQTLATASGCGVVIAAEIIGEIGDVSRFHSPGALAKYAGCAPREHSSGKTIRWRKTRSGNRRFNRSFHRMAFLKYPVQAMKRQESISREKYQKKKPKRRPWSICAGSWSMSSG